MKLPRVVIVIPNWNRRDDTLACLASVSRLDYPAAEVVVVDNASSDDSVAVIRAAHPEVTVIESAENLGFTGSSNLGLEHARRRGAEHMLLLNNDTEVAPDALGILVEAVESAPEVGIAGPTIYFFDRPQVIWSAGGAIDWSAGRCTMIGLNDADRGQHGERPRPVDFVSGCALLVKAAVLDRVGLLDPRFFAYYEEAEWCVRASRAGFRVVHVPQAKIWHKITAAERAASPTVHYYMTRNRLLFLQAVGAGWRAWLHTLVVEDLRTIVSWSLRPKWRSLRSQRNVMVRAILDYFRGRVGPADADLGTGVLSAPASLDRTTPPRSKTS